MKGGCKTILMLFVGIILGVLLTAGGLVAGGLWAYNNITIDKVESIVGGELIDLGEYNNKPIKDIIGEITNLTSSTILELDQELFDGAISSNLKFDFNGNIVDLTQTLFKDIMNSEISNVTNNLDTIKDNLTFGFLYNDMLLAIAPSLPNGQLATKYSSTPLEEAVEAIGEEKIMMIYPEDHTFEDQMLQTLFDSIKNLKINDLQDEEKISNAIDTIKINSLLSLSSSSTGILKALFDKDYTIGDLKVDTSFDSLLLNDILSLSSSSTGVLAAIYEKNWTLGDIKNANSFNTLSLTKVLSISNTATGILGAIRDRNWNLGDLTQSNINSLKLEEILEINSSSPKLLQSLKTSTLSSLSTDIEGLSLNKIIDISASSSKILQNLQSSTISSLATDIDNLRLKQVLDLGEMNYDSNNDSVMDSYKGFIGLILESDTNENGPQIKNLNQSISNIDITSYTLYELKARDIFTGDANLDKKLNGTNLGSYTIATLIEYLDTITTA